MTRFLARSSFTEASIVCMPSCLLVCIVEGIWAILFSLMRFRTAGDAVRSVIDQLMAAPPAEPAAAPAAAPASPK